MSVKLALYLMIFSVSLYAVSPRGTAPLPNQKILSSIINTRINMHHQPLFNATFKIASEKQLGMNNLPVLQGDSEYETIYASTAAFDAALNQGDYLSQLCLIQLINHITSGLDEMALGENLNLEATLNKLEHYGYILKKDEQKVGCIDPKASLSYEQYHPYSHNLIHKIDDTFFWGSILNINRALQERVDTGKTLFEIQQAISKGRRVTFSFITQPTEDNPFGTEGTHHKAQDTWLLSAKKERNLPSGNLEGHSMIITGYDNETITVDEEGEEHKGLLTLRSSWGSQVGDNGDFYMSYDYFRLLVVEAQEIFPYIPAA